MYNYWKRRNGKTQLAKWFAQFWNKERQIKKMNIFVFVLKI